MEKSGWRSDHFALFRVGGHVERYSRTEIHAWDHG